MATGKVTTSERKAMAEGNGCGRQERATEDNHMQWGHHKETLTHNGQQPLQETDEATKTKEQMKLLIGLSKDFDMYTEKRRKEGNPPGKNTMEEIQNEKEDNKKQNIRKKWRKMQRPG